MDNLAPSAGNHVVFAVDQDKVGTVAVGFLITFTAPERDDTVAGSVKEQHLAALGMAQEADFRDIGEPLDILQDGHRAPVGLGVEPFRKGNLERQAAFRPPDRVFPGRHGEGREAQGEREERTFHIHSV